MRTAMCKKLCGILALLMVLTAFLCACGGGKKTALTVKAFKTVAEKYDLIVREENDIFEGAKETCTASDYNSDVDYLMASIAIMESKSDAESYFEDAIANVVEDGAEIEFKGDYKFCEFTDEGEEEYGCMFLVGETIFFVGSSLNHKDDAKGFIRDMGL